MFIYRDANMHFSYGYEFDFVFSLSFSVQVFTFGRNSEGQLCAGNTLPQNIPVPVRNYHTTCTPTVCRNQ